MLSKASSRDGEVGVDQGSNENENYRFAVRVLRILGKHATRKELAAAVKVNPSTLGRFEDGSRPVERPMLERLADAAGFPMWAVEGILVPAISFLRAAGIGLESLSESDRRALAGVMAMQSTVFTVAEFLGSGHLAGVLASTEAHWPGVQGVADDPWTQLSHGIVKSEPDRYLEFENFCVELCAESIRAAASDPAQALRLARLAVVMAGLGPGPKAQRLRLEALAWGFVANATRIAGDLVAAASAFREAWRLWSEGESHPRSRLEEWRLLDLEASLLRDQRRFVEALRLLDRALAGAPIESHGRILINRAFVHEQAGEIMEATATLDAAAPLVESRGDAEESWTLRFNRGVLLCHAGLFSDVERDLPALHRQAMEAGYDLRVLRVKWLSARVWRGLGRHEEARATLEETRGELARRGLGGDAAMVAMDLALLHLEAGRTAEVRKLASEMLVTFAALNLGPEAMSSIWLFHQAAENQTLTVEVVQEVLSCLEKTRGSTGLRESEHRRSNPLSAR